MKNLSIKVKKPGRAIFLLENGERVGAAWVTANGAAYFALHGEESPVETGEAESLSGAVTDLYGAYVRHTGSTAPFPEAV